MPAWRSPVGTIVELSGVIESCQGSRKTSGVLAPCHWPFCQVVLPLFIEIVELSSPALSILVEPNVNGFWAAPVVCLRCALIELLFFGRGYGCISDVYCAADAFDLNARYLHAITTEPNYVYTTYRKVRTNHP